MLHACMPSQLSHNQDIWGALSIDAFASNLLTNGFATESIKASQEIGEDTAQPAQAVLSSASGSFERVAFTHLRRSQALDEVRPATLATASFITPAPGRYADTPTHTDPPLVKRHITAIGGITVAV